MSWACKKFIFAQKYLSSEYCTRSEIKTITSPGNTEAKEFTSGHKSAEETRILFLVEAVLHRKVVTKTDAPVSSSAKCSSRALTLASVRQILVIFFKCKMSCSFILVPLGCSEHSAGKTLYLLRYAIMLVTLGEGHYLTFEGINLWAFHASVCRGLTDCPWTCI